jgi:hypothetical protein
MTCLKALYHACQHSCVTHAKSTHFNACMRSRRHPRMHACMYVHTGAPPA